MHIFVEGRERRSAARAGAVVCAALVALGAATACGRTPGKSVASAPASSSNLPLGEPERRDSAGIAIVENRGIAWTTATRWKLAADPHVDLGAAVRGDADDFAEVVNAVLLDNGRIVVADTWTRMLHVFDSTGAPIDTWGRGPNGSGTIFNVARMRRLPGNGVQIEGEGALGTTTVFDSMGRANRLLARAGRGSMPGEFRIVSGRSRVLGRLADGSTLTIRDLPRANDVRDGVVPHDALLLRGDSTGAVLDTLGRFYGGEESVADVEGRLITAAPGFARTPTFEMTGDRIIYADPRSFELRILDRDGALQRVVRVLHEPRIVDSAAIAGYKRERLAAIDRSYMETASQLPALLAPLAGVGASMRKRDQEERLARMRFPPTAPAFTRVIIDGAGNCWFEHFRMPGDVQPRWTVIDSSGRQLGEVETPRGFIVFDISRDYVLGRAIDLNDSPHVRLYRILKAG